jgi:hypothetical protein
MENIEDIEARVDELFQKSEDLNSEVYTLGAMAERISFFEHLRELIHQKEAENDEVAAMVLGWAYERLSQD